MKLTATQARIFERLKSANGEPVSIEELAELLLHGSKNSSPKRGVYVAMHRIRRALAEAGSSYQVESGGVRAGTYRLVGGVDG